MATKRLLSVAPAVVGLAVLVGCAFVGVSLADEGVEALTAPPPPPQLQDGEPLEPEVTILRTEREVVYEYRRNGILFMVEVRPTVGPAYFFVDVNGDGVLDYSPHDPRVPNVNQWVIYQW